jgi:hypothetical protein
MQHSLAGFAAMTQTWRISCPRIQDFSPIRSGQVAAIPYIEQTVTPPTRPLFVSKSKDYRYWETSRFRYTYVLYMAIIRGHPFDCHLLELVCVFCLDFEVLPGPLLGISTQFGQIHSVPLFSHPHHPASCRRRFSSTCSIFLVQFRVSHST